MMLDLIKLVATYGIATVIVIGGGLLLVSGSIPADDQITKGAIISMMGFATNWVFGETTRSSTARQTSRALAIVPGNGTPPPGEPSA